MEGKCLQGRPRPLPWAKFLVTWMMMRDLFAVANLFVYYCSDTRTPVKLAFATQGQFFTSLLTVCILSSHYLTTFACSDLMQLVGRQEGHSACKKTVLVCWWWWSDWRFARLKKVPGGTNPPPLSVAAGKSRMSLTFWYQFTYTVLKYWPLKECCWCCWTLHFNRVFFYRASACHICRARYYGKSVRHSPDIVLKRMHISWNSF